MSFSNEDLQKYLGQNAESVKKELESRGSKVQLVRVGNPAGDCTVKQPPLMREKPEKHVSMSFNGDDPENKVLYIKLVGN